MLSSFHSDLEKRIEGWTEDCPLGEVILTHSQTLLKVYPTFINYFEQTKESILELERNNPRFKVSVSLAKMGNCYMEVTKATWPGYEKRKELGDDW